MELVLDHVTKIYPGGRTALDDLSLKISGKQFVTVVGPSGCGKTTLLRLIAGLEKATEGGIYIDGRDCERLSPKDRSVTMVFQNYALFPYMNVYDNIAFGLKVAGEDKEIIAQKVTEAARILGLTAELKAMPRQLSGGQRQRVVLGRVMVRRPRLCLLDEPLSNLDSKLRTRMRAEIKELYERLDATFIYVTHDQVEAMTMGTRVAVLESGRLKQFDEPGPVYESPADKFVASFIGQPEMNFLEGKAEGGKLRLCGAVYDVPCPKDEVTVGVRPEDVRIIKPSRDAIKATVVSKEVFGRSITLYVTNEWGRIAVSSPEAYEAGETVYLEFDVHRLHIFDPITGLNIGKL